MTITQAASALGVSRSRIYNLLEQGRLSAVKDNRGVFQIPDHEIKHFVKKPVGRPSGAKGEAK